MPYADVIETIKVMGRPGVLVFEPEAEAAAPPPHAPHAPPPQPPQPPPLQQAAPPGPPGPPSPQMAEIQRLYGTYNPEKLAEAPALAAKYGEEKLLMMVRKKYSGQEGKQAPQGADLAERSQTPPGWHSTQAQVTVGGLT